MKVDRRSKLYTTSQSDSFRFLVDEATPSGVMTAISTIMPSALYALEEEAPPEDEEALLNQASGACPAGSDNIPVPSLDAQVPEVRAGVSHSPFSRSQSDNVPRPAAR